METQGLEQPFKYVGKYGVQHEGDELYYMRARYYDADTGRFTMEDPIGIEGGLNVSLYGNANPVVFVDPSGLLTVEAIFSINLPSFPGVGELGDSGAKPRGVSVGVGFSIPFFDGGDFDAGITGTVSVGGGASVGLGRVSVGITASGGSLRGQRGISTNAGFSDGVGGLSAGIDERGNASAGFHIGPGYEVFVEHTDTGVLSVRDGLDYLFGC